MSTINSPIIEPTSPIKLSTNFTLEEAITSDTAQRLNLLNIPPAFTIITMKQVAFKMENIRSLLDSPIHINSWYRCPALNAALGSKDTSQHRVGEAVDFKAPTYGTPLEICRAIISTKNKILFDQLILEHSWVHISFAILSGKPRGQVLSLLNGGHYVQGLTDPQGVPYK